ncbi:MAG: SDR family NAD(P)-dependent oxidoreductase [Actinobacteria bacterium]|nr:SDR family NAD(P)-dependent oxidoreductase [Actinomycetota bacterium]
MILVPLGKTGGATHLPFLGGIVLGDFAGRMKGTDLFVPGFGRGETVQWDQGEAGCGGVARRTRRRTVLSGLAGRPSLGTGGSRGLELAMCRTLARASAQAAVHPARDAVRAVAVEREIVAGGGRAVPVGVDFHDVDAVRAMVVRAQDRLDGIGVHAPTSPQPGPSVPPE